MFCLPKNPTPCHRYDPEKPDELNSFLMANGGNEATIRKDGTADILTIVHDEPRFIYCKPGGWLRAVGQCRFNASSDKAFRENYNLLD